VITNTFVGIIEAGFLSTKSLSRFEWLKKHENDEKEGGADNLELEKLSDAG